jgi:hypothetical protein
MCYVSLTHDPGCPKENAGTYWHSEMFIVISFCYAPLDINFLNPNILCPVVSSFKMIISLSVK